MTGRSFVLSMATVAVVFAIAGRCSAPDPEPLPAKTQARVTRHQVQTVVDSTEIRRLMRERDRARDELQEQTVIAANAEGAAMAFRNAAKSLRASVDSATTTADSARAWHLAYEARTLEADSLGTANERLHQALRVAAHERMVVDSAYSIMAGHAARSDTLIAELLPLAQRRDHCQILGLVRCPTRKQTAIAAAVATIAVSVRLQR